MGNMSYCRFQNTKTDLKDCAEALDEVGGDIDALDVDERFAAKKLVELCRLGCRGGVMKGHEYSRALRDPSHAKYPFTSLGFYPLYLVTADGGCLCHACAVSEKKLIRRAAMCPGTDKQWEPLTFEANWEDPALYCDHCCERIESAYAEPDVHNNQKTSTNEGN